MIQARCTRDFSGINQPMTEARLREDLAILNVKLPGEK